MHTFLFVAGMRAGSEQRILETSLAATTAAVPPGEEHRTSSIVLLPEIRGGFFLFRSDFSRDLIEHWTTPELAVLLWGDLLGHKAGDKPRHVARIWSTGGASAVHALDGLFQAIIVDRRSGTVEIVSDAVGSRTCRYRFDGGLYVSPHDMALVASNPVDLDLDLTSIATSLSFGWSLMGRGFLRGIETTDATSFLSWANGNIARVAAARLITDDRVESLLDPRALDVQEEMIELLRHGTREAVADAPRVRVDLTAGVDSRALLALLLSVTDRRRILSTTYGHADSSDARTASRLARRMHVRYELAENADHLESRLATYSGLLGFCVNGDHSAQSLWLRDPAHADLVVPHLYGGGGELYRGFYYPRPFHSETDVNPSAIFERLHLARASALPWQQPELLSRVAGRLHETIAHLTGLAPTAIDVLDLFYAYERIARWNSIMERHPYRTNISSPFKLPQLVRLAFRLPAGSGDKPYLHERIIRRFAPKVRWWPVNDREIIQGTNPSSRERWLRRCRLKVLGIRSRLGRTAYKWGAHPPHPGLGKLETDLFAGPLAAPTRERLLAGGSIAVELFSAAGTERLLDEHERRHADHTQTLGLLLSMESWRRQIHEARAIARQSFR